MREQLPALIVVAPLGAALIAPLAGYLSKKNGQDISNFCIAYR